MYKKLIVTSLLTIILGIFIYTPIFAETLPNTDTVINTYNLPYYCKLVGVKNGCEIILYTRVKLDDTFFTKSSSTAFSIYARNMESEIYYKSWGAASTYFHKYASSGNNGLTISCDNGYNWSDDICVVDANYTICNYVPPTVNIISPTSNQIITDLNTSIRFSVDGGFDGYKIDTMVQKFNGTDYIDYQRIPKYSNLSLSLVDGLNNLSILPNEFPWGNAKYRLQFKLYKTSYNDVPTVFSFDFEGKFDTPFVKVIIPQYSCVAVPEVQIQKFKYNYPVDVYINDTLVESIVDQTILKTMTFKAKFCKIGDNVVTVKKRDGTVVATGNFGLSAGTDGEIVPNANEDIQNNETKVDATGKPIRPTGNGIIDWVIYGFNYVGWSIGALGNGVSSIVSQTANFGSLVQTWFYYLPNPYTQVMVLAVSLGILLRIFNR